MEGTQPEMKETQEAKHGRLRGAIRSRLSTQSGPSCKIRSGEDSTCSFDEGLQKGGKVLKEALNVRFKKDLHLNQLTNLDGYDTDAEIIPTPAGSHQQSRVDVRDNLEERPSDTRLLLGLGSDRICTHQNPARTNMQEERAICDDRPKMRRHCSSSNIGPTNQRGSNPPFLSLIASLDLLDPTSTFPKQSVLQSRITKRKPLSDLVERRSEKSDGRQELNHPSPGYLGKAQELQENRIEDGAHRLSEFEYHVCPLRQHDSQQGNSENTAPLQQSLATIRLPPKSPFRSNSGSSCVTATKLQSRTVSSGSYSGDSSFRYTGSFRPPIPKAFEVTDALRAPPEAGTSETEQEKKQQQSRKSRFREEFHISKPPSIGNFDGNEDQLLVPAATVVRNLDGSEDRLSVPATHSQCRPRIREHGFMPHSDEAVTLWEKALQMHAREVSAKQNRPYLPSQSGLWVASRRNLAASNPSPDHSVRYKRRGPPSIDSADIAPDVVIPAPATRLGSAKDRSTDSWARWPSHTRNERAGSAGLADKVRTYDFATRHELSRSDSMIERTKQKHVPISGSRNFFDIIRDRYINERSDLLRLERGYRSSVSTGGVLKYPDLELLPSLEPVHLLDPHARETSSNFSNQVSSEESPLGDFRRSSSVDTTPFPRTAKAWSRLYQECVPSPPFSEGKEEGDEPASNRSGLLSPTYVPRQPSKVHLIRNSHSDSVLDVRKSTLDFQESLRIKAEQSRKAMFEAFDNINQG
ncbi:MAG: hypothetical protein LQ340_006138 [Diploschistes diacapsis]|nr:MAG: hypothetical protein LQ340_006138 [Diploschistes diacapsis]